MLTLHNDNNQSKYKKVTKIAMWQKKQRKNTIYLHFFYDTAVNVWTKKTTKICNKNFQVQNTGIKRGTSYIIINARFFACAKLISKDWSYYIDVNILFYEFLWKEVCSGICYAKGRLTELSVCNLVIDKLKWCMCKECILCTLHIELRQIAGWKIECMPKMLNNCDFS